MEPLLKHLKAAQFKRKTEDKADVVQRVVLIAGFTVVAILLATWLGQASVNKGADAAMCTERHSSLTYNGEAIGGLSQNSGPYSCGLPEGGGTHSVLVLSSQGAFQSGQTFTRDSGFASRYPGQNRAYMP